MIKPAKLLRTALLTVAVSAACMIGASAASGVGTVNTDALRLRDEANTTSTILATASKGDTVVILGTGIIGISSLQWCKARGARVIVVGRGRHRLDIAKKCGAVCLAALYEDPFPVNPQYIVNKEPKILGACDNDLLGAMKGILAGTVSVEPLLDGIVGIEDFQEAFDRQMNGTAEKILIDMTR